MNYSKGYMKQLEEIYVSYYAKMKRFAIECVLNEEDAENIIHEIFLNILEKKIDILSIENIGGYLLVSLKNRCIDFIRKKKIDLEMREIMRSEYYHTLVLGYDTLESLDDDVLYDSEIGVKIQAAIDNLPPKCREIFIMSKIERKRHKQIAEDLGISVKTIESQITIAFKKLRIELGQYISLILFIF